MDILPKCDANYVPLTPITFLKRAAQFYANRPSLIYEGTRFTWQQTYGRCRRLASSLRVLNVVKNDVVSVLAPNVPALYEMHFAVPMAGAVLNAISTMLDDKTIATILKTSSAKVFFVDYQFVPLARDALRLLHDSTDSNESSGPESSLPLVIVIDDIDSPTGIRLGELEYEQLILDGNPRFNPIEVEDEWDSISLNYTSGTTSEPKGVVYSHRGAYLSTLSFVLRWEMGSAPIYLWAHPMFHENGWTLTWGVAARGGTNVCLRNTTAYDIYQQIYLHKVTHMCCAPNIFNILIDSKPHERKHIDRPVQVVTGGAPPPTALLEKVEGMGFHITHAYGLSEATGPALVCEWQQQWNQLPKEDQAKLRARQGISILTLAEVDVKDVDTMSSVPRDGNTMGEVVLRGSSLMKGYFNDIKATAKAFKNGWYLTGDMGVVHPDGYLEIKDRSMDVIKSGGENISSIEVESVLYKHDSVLEAAVVGMADPLWGETPLAYVSLKKNNIGGITETVKESDIIGYCRKNLPHFMVPKRVEFLNELPKTSTGKIQKFKLRILAKTLTASRDVVDESTHVGAVKPRYDLQPHHQIHAMSRL